VPASPVDKQRLLKPKENRPPATPKRVLILLAPNIMSEKKAATQERYNRHG